MKRFMDNMEWEQVPKDQVEDWDKFCRYVSSYLLARNIYKAAALIALEGERWTVSIDLKPLPVEQIN